MVSNANRDWCLLPFPVEFCTRDALITVEVIGPPVFCRSCFIDVTVKILVFESGKVFRLQGLVVKDELHI